MVESVGQSSRVEGSVSSQYGRNPNTSRRSPPGSTAAARVALTADRGSTQGVSTGPLAWLVTLLAATLGSKRGKATASRIARPDSRPAGRLRGDSPATVQRSEA